MIRTGSCQNRSLLPLAGTIVLAALLAAPAGISAAQRQMPGTPRAGQPLPPSNPPHDPTSLKLFSGLNFAAPVDNTKISSPAPVKSGIAVPLTCTWKATFVKPAVVQTPVNLTISIAETTAGVVQLKQATGLIKPGDYSFPGQVAQGEVKVSWTPHGLGIHHVNCLVSTTSKEWWGNGALPMMKSERMVQVEPDSFKLCPPMYSVQLTKSPQGDKYGVAGTVVPTEVMLFFSHSLSSGNQFTCHYHSKQNDIPDVGLTVPCSGARKLPPQADSFLKQDRYYCNERAMLSK
jgi:hypothetical protein